MAKETVSRISFFSKKEIVCPVCDTKFYREDILTGRGRLIAGDLTSELRRLYEPSRKYGDVYPLVYPVTVCPGCHYSVFPQDFSDIDDDTRQKVADDTDERIESVQKLFDDLDYREPRRLQEGIGSCYLAMRCYDSFPRSVSPTVKQGILALRAAWSFLDLHGRAPGENYDYLSRMFFRKARFFYNEAIELEQNGVETVANAGNLGPDVDQNYGYDGVLYLASYLEFHYGPREDEEKRMQALSRAKTIVARLFGMGKASKEKPSVILEKARDLYAEIRVELQEEDDEPDERSSFDDEP